MSRNHRTTIVGSPFQLRPRSPARATPRRHERSLQNSTSPPLFSDAQPTSPRLLAPLSIDKRQPRSTGADVGNTTVYDHRKPPSRGESSVPSIAKQKHYHHADDGTVRVASRSMSLAALHKDFGEACLPGEEAAADKDDIPAHHDRIMGSLSKQIVTKEVGVSQRIREEEAILDECGAIINAFGGSPAVPSIRLEESTSAKMKLRTQTAPSRTDRVSSANYIGEAAGEAFFDLCAETQRERCLRTPNFNVVSDVPEAAFDASESETADMTPRQAFINVLSESVFDGANNDVHVCGLTPSPIIIRSGRPKLHLKRHTERGSKGENDLNLSHHKLGDDYAMVLSHTLDALPMLSNLNLRDNRLTDRGMAPIINAVTHNEGCRQITNLDLGDNKLDSEAIHELASFIQQSHCAIKRLGLAKADIDDGEACIFAEALGYNRTITHLDLSNNLIGGTAERLVASKMGINNSVSDAEYDVMLRAQEAQDGNPPCAGIALGHALRINGTLRVLNLSWNQLGRISGIEIGHALGANNCLRELIVSNNSLGDAGAQLFGDALRTNETLNELDMSNNDIRNRGACVLAGALHTNRRLRKFMLNNNPLGKFGGRAMLGTWNFMEFERTIRMRECSFDLLDPDPNSFDPSKPGGTYRLEVGNPLRGAYDKYVAHELCRMATVRNGHRFERIEHILKGTAREIRLKRVDTSAKPASVQPKLGLMKKKSMWKRAKEKAVSKGTSYWSDLNAKEAKAAVQDFALVNADTGEKWQPPEEGILNIVFMVESALPSALESINMTGLVGLVDLMMSSPGERMMFLELASMDIRFTCHQMHILIEKVNETHLPLTGDEIVKVFSHLLPRALDVENVHNLIDSHLSFKQHQELLGMLGQLYVVIAGTICGHYSLDLRKNDNDRILLERLAGLSAAERRFNLTKREEDPEDTLHGGRGTNERGKWGAFRNVKYNSKETSEPQVQGLLRRRLQRASAESDNAHVEFDYAPAVRAPAHTNPLTHEEFVCFLKRCAIFDVVSIRRTLNRLGRMPGADQNGKAKGKGKKKPSSPPPDSGESDITRVKRENCKLRDIYLAELSNRDLRKAVSLPLKGRTASGRSFDDDISEASVSEDGNRVLSEHGKKARMLSDPKQLQHYLGERRDRGLHIFRNDEEEIPDVLSASDCDSMMKLVRCQNVAFVEGFGATVGATTTRVEVFLRIRIMLRTKEPDGRYIHKVLTFRAPGEAISPDDDPFATQESSNEKKEVAKEMESKAERKAKKLLNLKKKTLKLMEKGVLDRVWRNFKGALFGTDLRTVFNRRDRDGGGSLDKEEFKKMVRLDMRLPASSIEDVDLDKLIILLDDDGGGELGVEELVEFAEKGPKVFVHLMDAENSVTMAKTSRKQKRKWAKELDPTMIERLQTRLKAALFGTDIETVFKRRDKDRGGTLDFAEFVKLIRIDLKVPTADVADADLEKIMVLLDDDSSGELGVKEIKDLMERGMEAFSDVITSTTKDSPTKADGLLATESRFGKTPEKKRGRGGGFMHKVDTKSAARKLNAAAWGTAFAKDNADTKAAKVARQQTFVGARMPVDIETGITYSTVTKSAMVLADIYLSQMNVKDMGGNEPERHVVEVCKLEYDRAPCAPHTLEGLETHVSVHYCDVYLESTKAVVIGHFTTEDEHGAKEWQISHGAVADPIPGTISAMVDPRQAWSPVRQILETQFRLGSLRLTTDQAVTMLEQIKSYYQWNLIENLAVSLFDRVVDLENWKDVLLKMEALYKENHPQASGLSFGAQWNTGHRRGGPGPSPAALTASAASAAAAAAAATAITTAAPNISTGGADASVFKSELREANPPGFKGIVALEQRIGWLNMLNPCEVEDIRFDLDMGQYEDWFVGRVLVRLAFKEDGDNFQKPFYRRNSPMWVNGWNNPPAEWNELDYEGAMKSGPPPQEGELVVTYRVPFVERDEDEREKLKNGSFLCGMPRPPKDIYSMESDFHLYGKYI